MYLRTQVEKVCENSEFLARDWEGNKGCACQRRELPVRPFARIAAGLKLYVI